jgi:hypothetical protein
VIILHPLPRGCTVSRDCTAFSSYLGVFKLFAVQCCADVHFFVVIRRGVSLKIVSVYTYRNHVCTCEWRTHLTHNCSVGSVTLSLILLMPILCLENMLLYARIIFLVIISLFYDT